MVFMVRNKTAVLGAGVMGAQIAAHRANADAPDLLFDLPAEESDPSGVAKRAIENLKKLSPTPLATRDRASYVEAANYDQHLDKLKDCDLVIEAIAERMDWKLDLDRRIAPSVAPHAALASNTSGLSIETMAEGLPKRSLALPRRPLLRRAPLDDAGPALPLRASDRQLLDDLETFLITMLGKGVVGAFREPEIRIFDRPQRLAARS